MSDDKYTPNMEKLKAELGRTPPSMVDQSRPLEDYAPKPKPTSDDYNKAEVEIAQIIKSEMRLTEGWKLLSTGEKEALERIATDIGRIIVGRNFWSSVGDWAILGNLSSSGEPQ